MAVDQLAIGAVAILAPALSALAAKAGDRVTESLAAKAGVGAGGLIDALFQAVRRKFAADRDSDAEQTLASLQAKPDSQPRQAALSEVLAEKAQADPAFARELAALVEQAGEDRQVTQFLTQVYGNARVKNILSINRAGDLTIQ